MPIMPKLDFSNAGKVLGVIVLIVIAIGVGLGLLIAHLARS